MSCYDYMIPIKHVNKSNTWGFTAVYSGTEKKIYIFCQRVCVCMFLTKEKKIHGNHGFHQIIIVTTDIVATGKKESVTSALPFKTHCHNAKVFLVVASISMFWMVAWVLLCSS